MWSPHSRVAIDDDDDDVGEIDSPSGGREKARMYCSQDVVKWESGKKVDEMECNSMGYHTFGVSVRRLKRFSKRGRRLGSAEFPWFCWVLVVASVEKPTEIQMHNY
jgi:hypothetical protein